MASIAALPNEILLLILECQTSIRALLSISSVNHNIRSLYLQNSNSILSSVCRSSPLLVSAYILAETVAEVAVLPSHMCDCDDFDDNWDHWHKDLAGQQYAADARTDFPAELRFMRAVSRAVSLSSVAAGSAARFWTSKAKGCAADHGNLNPDTTKIAQIYMFLWFKVQVHYSRDHMARFAETLPELEVPALNLISDMNHFITLHIDRPTQLQLGIADPEVDMDDIMEMEFTDPDQDWHFAKIEWCWWFDLQSPLECPRKNKLGPTEWKRLLTKWQKQRAEGCNCPGRVLTNWDRVRIDWWHTWDQKTGTTASKLTASTNRKGLALMKSMTNMLMGYEPDSDHFYRKLREDWESFLSPVAKQISENRA